MRVLIIALAVAFVLLPYDAQLALIAPLRLLWLTDGGRSVILGALGASVAAMVWYAAGWNGLAAQLYREDKSKADDTYRKRTR